jgi:hypothetical protein
MRVLMLSSLVAGCWALTFDCGMVDFMTGDPVGDDSGQNCSQVLGGTPDSQPAGGMYCRWDWQCGYSAPDAIQTRTNSGSTTGSCLFADGTPANGAKVGAAAGGGTGPARCFCKMGYGCQNCAVQFEYTPPIAWSRWGAGQDAIPQDYRKQYMKAPSPVSAWWPYMCGATGSTKGADVREGCMGSVGSKAFDQCAQVGGAGWSRDDYVKYIKSKKNPKYKPEDKGSGATAQFVDGVCKDPTNKPCNPSENPEVPMTAGGSQANNPISSPGSCTVGKMKKTVAQGDASCDGYHNAIGGASGICIALDPKKPEGEGRCACDQGYYGSRCEIENAFADEGAKAGDLTVVGGGACETDTDCYYKKANPDYGTTDNGGKCVAQEVTGQKLCECFMNARRVVDGKERVDSFVCPQCEFVLADVVGTQFGGTNVSCGRHAPTPAQSVP